MRRCLIGDILCAANALAAVAETQRPALVRDLVQQADAAHRYCKRFGRPHPQWGNGSLMARALAQLDPAAPAPAQRSFLASLALVAETLAARAGKG